MTKQTSGSKLYWKEIINDRRPRILARDLRPALLVIDPQNDFFAGENPNLAEFQATVPIINSTIAVFRDHRWPIIFVQHTSRKKLVGSQAWAISEQFDFRSNDVQLSKTHYNSFWNTELDSLLKSYRVDFVVISGYIAEYCVLATLRGALERGYRGAILEKSIASLNSRYTQFTMEISPHIDLDELEANAN